MDYDPGMGSYRPQETVTLCTIPGQCATSDQTKRPYQVVYVLNFFRVKLKPEILDGQIFSSVLSRTTKYSIYQIATSSSIMTSFEELNDEGSDTVFQA